MPFFYRHIISKEAQLAIWQIEESEDWFRERLILSDLEAQQLEIIKGHRRLGMAASSLLVVLNALRLARGVQNTPLGVLKEA